jgi:hypothetical protein
VVSGAVVAFRLVVLFGKLDGYLELGQDVAFNVQGDFGGVRWCGRITHESAEMVGAEVDLVSKSELGGGDAKRVGSCRLLEDLVAAGVLQFEGEFAIGVGPGIGAVERECTDMDGLAGLIDGLLSGQEDRRLVLEKDGLSEFGRADWGICDVVHLVVAGESGRKAELGLDGAPTVEPTGKEGARSLIRDKEFDTKGPGLGGVVVVGVGDDYSDGGLAAREVLGLAKDVDYGATEHLRDRLYVVNDRELVIVVLEAIANTLPDDVFKGKRFLRGDGLLPGALTLGDIDWAFDSAEDIVFGVENFDGESARALARGVIGDSDR